ncbi:MAG: cadherin-like beta sandwich domain-containing protein [Verrucomicrobia bacterium]|nr:cadherin-like beta sandwich domain-containing protein [Verrucomicrobiota bacterium]
MQPTFIPVRKLVVLAAFSLLTPAFGAVVTATFDSAATVPVTAATYNASGNSVDLSLNFEPAVGTNLTVVNNTGLAFIQGTFGNLEQGQAVTLTFGGVPYGFVANYYGGTGNDLVLQWANTRLLAWGSGTSGTLGNNTAMDSGVPVAVDRSGALAGKSVAVMTVGSAHCQALTADGTLTAWGSNSIDQLGDGGVATVLVPKNISSFGVIAAKRVVAVDAGASHSLGLMSDGTVAAWGENDYGSLGDNSTNRAPTPVAVLVTGALAGKSVVAVAAGEQFSLALCSDGAMAAWGKNIYGQLGNGSMTKSTVPVLVSRTGALASKQVVAVAAGGYQSFALCGDGTVVGWGYNSEGELGAGNTTTTLVPQAVVTTGALSGKRVSSLAAGQTHTLALCTDGTLVAWGHNGNGQLGNGTTTQSAVPILVSRAGVLAGKTVVAISAGSTHSLALCSDGSLAAWGQNNVGQLGNNSTTQSTVPVLVNSGALASGEIIRGIAAGGSSRVNLALVASPLPPTVSSLAATGVTDSAVTLNGSVNASGGTTGVAFEYGLTTGYGSTAAATPATVTGTTATAVSATLTGLVPGTTYHFRVVATIGGGTVKGADRTFATTTAATLSGLSLSSGVLSPAFVSRTLGYASVVPFASGNITVTPVTTSPTATVTVNGVAATSGTASAPVALAVGNNLVPIVVSAAGGGNSLTYTVLVTRLPEVFTFGSATDVPVTVGGLLATGLTANFALNFAPAVGTRLTAVNNTGLPFIQGTFSNLAQGQRVDLTYNGVSYAFVANYFGGDGNDLVLQWANNRLVGWGYNGDGQLGNGGTTNSPLPVGADMTGALAGKTVMGVAAGSGHNIAYCADGTVVAWGTNTWGQLGNGTTTFSKVPVAVDRSGVLAGKKVIAAVAAGTHSVVLCSDGTVASWGYSDRGALGAGGSMAYSPVAVVRTGVLAGKTVVAIAGGINGVLALCSDGTLVAWGYPSLLGNNTVANSDVPVAVDMTGVLAGKQPIAIAAGDAHGVALCADGTLAAWGSNEMGALGNTSATFARVPVLVDRTGALAGRTVTNLATNYFHNHVLCADGTLAAWGVNNYGQLGNNSTTNGLVPVLTNIGGVLSGRTVTRIKAGYGHCLAFCADASVAAWGANTSGQLGNNTTTNSSVPVLVNQSTLRAGERMVDVAAGGGHCLAIVAMPALPVVSTLAATGIMDTGAVLAGSVNANGSGTSVSFEYGLTTAYGGTVAATPSPVTGTTTTAVSAAVGGLVSGVTYHYRVTTTGPGGTLVGNDMIFTTTTAANLSGLTVSGGALLPDFTGANTSYAVTVPNDVSMVQVTPVVAVPTSTVRVRRSDVESGTPSRAIQVTVGNNPIGVVVTAADGINTMTYTVTVTRLPAVFSFAAPTTVPVVAGDFAAVGDANFALNFAPSPGAVLKVVDNTGFNPIRGSFANLGHGQRVELTFGSVGYAFVANYFGGSGNDLVLQWANTRLLTWGNGVKVPTAMAAPGVLAGKTVTAVASGQGHVLALCADGSVAAWGNNGRGELGNGTVTDSTVPVAVTTSGVLAGKKVVAIAAGYAQSIALCADGTVVTWGGGLDGQLGNGTVTSSSVPVLVNRSGVLAGKTVTAIASGMSYNLALCSDGTLAAWGSNQYGALGIGSLVNSSVPALVDRSGVLLHQRIVSPAGGGYHGMALCDDGAVAAWGNNGNAQLGNGVWVDSPIPVMVDRNGVLAGKRIIDLVGGGYHSLARCADGTLVAWGTSDRGQLGNNSTSSTAVPVQVVQTGVLANKSVVALGAGVFHSLALCSDGTLAAWGYNDGGQLGNNSTTQSTVPVLVNTGALRTGERVMALDGGTTTSVALVASPLQTAASVAATAITGTGAALHGTVNANGNPVTVAFEYGLDTTYGSSVAGSPPSASGSTAIAVDATLAGLTPGTTYHYRVVATGSGGTARGADLTFTTLSDNAKLAGLGLSSATLVPEFAKDTTAYLSTVPFAATGVTVTPTTDHPAATVKINGVAAASAVINLPVGNTAINTVVTAEDGVTTKTYTINVTRLPLEFAFNAATDVPVTANAFAAGGYPATLNLNYAPVPGTILTMVNNTGLGFISGAFGNLEQGQRVNLSYGGKSYDFAVNYYGGSGNDLVLQWADTKVAAWGSNSFGQLGDANVERSLQPAFTDATGVLAGKTVVAVGTGYLHSLALCADGTLATWGYNIFGQIGDGGTASGNVPVAVDRSGVLAGETVVAISAGPFHNLALCSDGTVVAWGYNNHGQLGDGSVTTRRTPVVVNPTGALAGKQVVAVAAGAYHSFALCGDGSIAAWGYNDEGELGNGATAGSLVPVSVALSGRKAVALAAGTYHTLALCADGTLLAWGYNHRGQLGNASTAAGSLPTAINAFGILTGKAVTAIRAGGTHSVAWCGDGTVAVWGSNHLGQLGVAGTVQSTIPVAVDLTSLTAIAPVAGIATGGGHSLALGAEGALFAWGDNTDGQLGDGGTTSRATPAAVDFAGLTSGIRVMAVSNSHAARHNLALIALPAGSTGKSMRQTSAGMALESGDDLLSVAFGVGAGRYPQPQREGDDFVIRFTQPAGVTGIRYGAEWSATMQPGSWRNVPDTGVGGEHRFAIPAAGQPQGFLRLKVTRE